MMRPGALVTFVLVTLLVTPAALASLTDGMQNDANTGGDASDSYASPTPIMGGMYTGQTFMVADPADWYTFAVLGPLDIPVVEVHMNFTISSPTCTGAQIPLQLQTVTMQLIDPAGHVKGNFVTGGCNASGHFDVAETPPTHDNQTTGLPNPGIGNWTIGVTIDGAGGTPLPTDPAGLFGHVTLAQASTTSTLPAQGPPHRNAPPPNPEEDYMFQLGCKPFC